MSARKTATGLVPPRRSINIDVELNASDDVEVIQSNLKDADRLRIEDESNIGGDPYNSTGQFCYPPHVKKSRD